jgi:hypothetical protein
MSRVVWGHGDRNAESGKRQTTLDTFVAPVRRARDDEASVEESVARSSRSVTRMAGASVALESADDGVQWGPSGGGNRETMQRRRARPFMNGAERTAALDSSPYSRAFMHEWQSIRVQHEASGAREGAPRTTEMDPALVAARFVPATCPRDIFAGKVFFLNSCGTDSLISVFQLEKVIRYLGGSTAMGVSSRVDFVITQHLASAKAAMLEPNRGQKTRAVHPHFVLACARAGAIVPVTEFLTLPDTPAARPQAATAAAAARDVIDVDS